MEVEKLKKYNMAAWSNALRKHGFNELGNSFDSDKNQDYERMKKVNLPVLDTINIPYNDFHENNPDVSNFIKKYNDLVVLTVPKKEGLQRSHKIGLKNFEEIKAFVDENIPSNHNEYYINLIEHKINIGSGIIISNENKIIVEIADRYLDELSYGNVIPVQGIFENNSIKYSTDNEVKRKIISDALNYIKKDNKFLKGYFEFIVVKGNKIIFFDYKINESYWKNV